MSHMDEPQEEFKEELQVNSLMESLGKFSQQELLENPIRHSKTNIFGETPGKLRFPPLMPDGILIKMLLVLLQWFLLGFFYISFL